MDILSKTEEQTIYGQVCFESADPRTVRIWKCLNSLEIVWEAKLYDAKDDLVMTDTVISSMSQSRVKSADCLQSLEAQSRVKSADSNFSIIQSSPDHFSLAS